MDIETAYNAILNKKAVLIAGSGINYGTKNQFGEDIPLGTSLAKMLYDLAGVTDPENETDLQDASENYIRKHSESELISLLRRKMSIGTPSIASRVIYSLPWLRIYTTNYDNLPMLASESEIDAVTTDSNPNRFTGRGRNLCVYINGFLGSIPPDKLLPSFKLTTESYLSEEGILTSEWGGSA